VAPICPGPIFAVEASQVPADGSCHLEWPWFSADPNPGLKMARAGFDHGAGFVPVVAHVCHGLYAVQINPDIAGIVSNA
jgi:hypothetical protein